MNKLVFNIVPWQIISKITLFFSAKITEEVLAKIADKNWKIRKEGLEEVEHFYMFFMVYYALSIFLIHV